MKINTDKITELIGSRGEQTKCARLWGVTPQAVHRKYKARDWSFKDIPRIAKAFDIREIDLMLFDAGFVREIPDNKIR